MMPRPLSPLFHLLFFSIAAGSMTCFGQQVFELTASGVSPSLAVTNGTGLLIREASGRETMYRRDSRFDDPIAGWSGYFSKDANQALRWPTNNSGPFQIGSLSNNGTWSFRASQMSIVTRGNSSLPSSSNQGNILLPTGPPTNPIIGNNSGNNSVLPTGASPQSLLALNIQGNQAPIPLQWGFGDSNRRQFLTRAPNGRLSFSPSSQLGNQHWVVVPVGNGLARVQFRENKNLWALGSQGIGSALDLVRIANRPDQLWRILPFPSANGCYALESLQYPGHAITFQSSQFLLSPLAYSTYQQWWPTTPILPPALPIYRTSQQQIVASPPLTPASITLVNRHQEALIVLIADVRPNGVNKKLKIPSNGRETVTFDRDAGATMVETYEIQDSFGGFDRQEYRTTIPPAVLYDVSVYEEFLQSIAIDRTGSSPNPIEDINYQPRSVGFVIIPPGDGLPATGSLDIYGLAVEANNPGAVRRLSPQDYDSKTTPTDPLRDILKQFQEKQRSF